MIKERKKIFAVVMAVAAPALMLAGEGLAESDQEGRVIKTMSGSVRSIDWVGSFITVDGLSLVTFTVASDAKIMQDSEHISLADIEIDDYVTVKYYDDSSGDSIAVKISVNKTYPAF